MAKFLILLGALAWAAVALAFPAHAVPRGNSPQIAACYRKGAVWPMTDNVVPASAARALAPVQTSLMYVGSSCGARLTSPHTVERTSCVSSQNVGQPAFSKRLYKLRWRIESSFNRLKDFSRIATRYDKPARN